MNLVFKHSYGHDSYGLVYENKQGSYDVYEIPLYGGEEVFDDTYATLDEAIRVAKSFT